MFVLANTFRGNSFCYTDKVGDKPVYVVDVELPGVDPTKVTVDFYRDKLLINGYSFATVPDRYDLTKATAELKYGLLKIVVPESTEGKGKIPLTVL